MTKLLTYVLTACIAALLLLTAFSCKRTEEQVIDDITRLSEEVERNGAGYDFEDWAEVFDELRLLEEDARYCDFTPRQAREFGRAQGQLQVRILREGTKTVTRAVDRFFAPFARGFLEGMIGESVALTAAVDSLGRSFDDGYGFDDEELDAIIERLIDVKDQLIKDTEDVDE